MKSYEWKMGEPCPVCGAEVPPTIEMMEHTEIHNLATGMVFAQRVLYFNIKNQNSKESAKNGN